MTASRWLVALLCLTLSAAAAADTRVLRSCRKWIEERKLAEGTKEMNRIPVLISKGWFLGFVAGRSSGGKRDLTAGIDDESIFLWLDNYCRDHPQDDLVSAGLALEGELRPGNSR